MFQHTKFGTILIFLTLGLVLFGVVRVFGGTQFNLTLRTNTSLENGLTNHWTFDGPDVDFSAGSGEILDRGSEGVDGDAVTGTATAVSVAGTPSNSGNQGTTASYTFAHNHSSGNYLVVGVTVHDGTNDVTGVTYNSAPMDLIVSRTGASGAVSLWGLANPSSGSNNVGVTIGPGSPTDSVAGAVSLANVDTIDPVSNTTSGSSNSSRPNVLLDTRFDGTVVVDTIFSEDAGGAAPDADQTEMWDVDLGQDLGAASYEVEATAGTVIMAWTTDIDLWYQVAAAFKPQTEELMAKGGKIGQGWEFDGDDDYIDVADAYPTEAGTAKTIAFWVRADEATSESIIDINGTNEIVTNASDQITVDGGAGATYYVDGVSGNRVITNGKWHHVVVTDSTGWNPSNFDIGRDGTAYFGGRMDDIRTYSRVLSASEISRLYELGATTRINISSNTATTTINRTITTNSNLENGLVRHYTFDGKNIDWSVANEILDRGTQGVSADVQGGSKNAVAPGKIGQGYDIEVADVEVTAVNTGLPTGDFTYSIWVRPNNLDNTRAILSSTLQTPAQYEMLVQISTAGAVVVFVDVATNFTASDNPIDVKRWSHVVLRRSGSEISVYVNGVKDSTTGTDGDALSFVCDLEMGGLTTGNTGDCNFSAGADFRGRIDDVRVYNRALSDAEILRLYQLAE